MKIEELATSQESEIQMAAQELMPVRMVVVQTAARKWMLGRMVVKTALLVLIVEPEPRKRPLTK